MTDRELVQQWTQPGAIVPVDMNTVRILITALRERLAQPEQEPIAQIECTRCGKFIAMAGRTFEAKPKEGNG